MVWEVGFEPASLFGDQNPQSYGEAERAVQTVRRLLKSDDSYLALLAYRTSPLKSGYGPAEVLMGRWWRSAMSNLPATLEPKWSFCLSFEKRRNRLSHVKS